jgi:hypothetical protein
LGRSRPSHGAMQSIAHGRRCKASSKISGMFKRFGPVQWSTIKVGVNLWSTEECLVLDRCYS